MKTLKRIYFTVVLNWQFLIAVIFGSVAAGGNGYTKRDLSLDPLTVGR